MSTKIFDVFIETAKNIKEMGKNIKEIGKNIKERKGRGEKKIHNLDQ